MGFKLEGSGQILARTPEVLQALLHGLPDDLLQTNYGPGTWSPHDVVGHLIHGERTDWMPRARQIMAHGDTTAFEPFDRNGHAALCREHTTSELLNLFASLRQTNLSELLNVSYRERYGAARPASQLWPGDAGAVAGNLGRS